MKNVLTIAAIAALAGCAVPPELPVDAAPVLQGGSPLKSAFGASVTGRDWNHEPSESKGRDDSADAK